MQSTTQQLQPSFFLRIKENSDYTSNSDDWVIKKEYDAEHFLDQAESSLRIHSRVGFFKALVIPVRTHNLKDFCKDFFLPSFFNHALKADSLALKIIQSLPSIFIDIATLSIRFITVIPRYIINRMNPKESHPLYKIIENAEIDEEEKKCIQFAHKKDELLQQNSVLVEFVYQELKLKNVMKYNNDYTKKIGSEQIPILFTKRNYQTIDLIPLPKNANKFQKGYTDDDQEDSRRIFARVTQFLSSKTDE